MVNRAVDETASRTIAEDQAMEAIFTNSREKDHPSPDHPTSPDGENSENNSNGGNSSGSHSGGNSNSGHSGGNSDSGHSGGRERSVRASDHRFAETTAPSESEHQEAPGESIAPSAAAQTMNEPSASGRQINPLRRKTPNTGDASQAAKWLLVALIAATALAAHLALILRHHRRK